MAELKPYSAYKDSGVEWIGEIPADWRVLLLARVLQVSSGLSVTNNDFNKEKSEEYAYPVIGGNGLMGYTRKYNVHKPTISIGRVGALCGNIHYIDYKSWITDNSLYITRYSEDLIDLEFLKYLLKNLNLNRYSTSTAQPLITGETVRRRAVPLPEKNQQMIIASYLKNKEQEIDSLISDKQRLIKLLEEKRQAIITETVTKGLDPNVKMKDSGIEWIGEIPEHWEVQKLKWIANVELSNVDKKTVENEIPVLLCNYVDVYYNDIIKNDLNFMKATAKKEQIEKFSLKKDDVIITKDSESPDDIAVPAWVSETMDNVLCGYHLAHLRPKSKLSGRFLLYCLLSATFQEQFHSVAYGVTRHGILKGDISNSLFGIPSLSEQEKIVQYLSQVDQEVRDIQEKITAQIIKLKEYRESLIYEAVTGKIDLRDYEAESSSDVAYAQVVETKESYRNHD